MEKLETMKLGGIAIISASLTFFTSLNMDLQGLMVFIVVDYISGFLVATVFRQSSKTQSGAYNSSIGFKGLVKKVYIIMLLVVLFYADKMANTDFLLSLGTIGFAINEVASIIENAGLMGLKLPKALTNALDVLKGKIEKEV